VSQLSNWRFIPFLEHDGATNMAIDIALLEKALESAPVLRLYGFSPPCVSIGLNQKIDPSMYERTREKGFDIVRRPSGGRAVLHHMDLTYAFIASEKNSGDHGILEHSVSNAYKQICLGLQEAFYILGVRTELGSAQAAYRHLADCFLATTNADLHHNGKKLAGSAQLRRHNCVLQHGSIPLALEQDAMAELLGERQAAKAERHANLFEILNRRVEISELNDAMRRGFEKAFQIEFDSEPLSREELEIAEANKAEYLCMGTQAMPCLDQQINA
jgi:lipoate-protein ligase A